MAGDTKIEPLLNLGGQMKDFESHECSSLGPAGFPAKRRQSDDAPSCFGVTVNIDHHANRFQYLSDNIL
jgi:hypothetical protein